MVKCKLNLTRSKRAMMSVSMLVLWQTYPNSAITRREYQTFLKMLWQLTIKECEKIEKDAMNKKSFQSKQTFSIGFSTQL